MTLALASRVKDMLNMASTTVVKLMYMFVSMYTYQKISMSFSVQTMYKHVEPTKYEQTRVKGVHSQTQAELLEDA